MHRYDGRPLGPRPHILVLGSAKVGNFLLSTPLLRGLRERYPEAVLDFLGSEVTAELERACPHITTRWSPDPARGSGDVALHLDLRRRAAGPYDLAINLDGFEPANAAVVPRAGPRFVVGEALDESGRRLPAGDAPAHRLLDDPAWADPGLVDRFPGLLTSNYMGEILCRLAFVETDFFRLETWPSAPDFEVPRVLVHTTATRSAKLWPRERWAELLGVLAERGWTLGLVGSAPGRQRDQYHSVGHEEWLLDTVPMDDLRGRTGLRELAGALARADLCVSVDAGPLHMAAAVGCPTLGIFGTDGDGLGASPRHLWAPRGQHVEITRSPWSCGECAGNRYRNEACLVDGHPCMDHLTSGAVLEGIDRLLSRTGAGKPERPAGTQAGTPTGTPTGDPTGNPAGPAGIGRRG